MGIRKRLLRVALSADKISKHIELAQEQIKNRSFLCLENGKPKCVFGLVLYDADLIKHETTSASPHFAFRYLVGIHPIEISVKFADELSKMMALNDDFNLNISVKSKKIAESLSNISEIILKTLVQYANKKPK